MRLEGAEGRKQIESVQGTEVYGRRGKLLPLTYLNRVLGLSLADTDYDVLNIVILQAEETAFGLVVDGVGDTQEIVVKALGKQLKALSCYVGATIMSDGKIALILDVPGLGRLANILSQSQEHSRSETKADEAAKDLRQTLLLFSAGRFPRLVVPLSLVARLEEFPASRVEYGAGGPVLHYRDAILPLAWVGAMLDRSAPHFAGDGDPLQVIVFSEGDRQVGLVVDQIQDIVEETVTVRQASTSFGLLGSGVVGGKIVDFIDLGALLQAGAGNLPEVFSSRTKPARTVLLADSSKIARGVLRGYLEMNGHQVVEAGTPKAALDALSRNAIQVVVAAATLGKVSAGDFLDAMRNREALAAIPALGLVDPGEETSWKTSKGRHFDGFVARGDREGLLRAIESLATAETTPELAMAGTSK